MTTDEQLFGPLELVDRGEDFARYRWSMANAEDGQKASLSPNVVMSVLSRALADLTALVAGAGTSPVSITTDFVDTNLSSGSVIEMDAKVDRKTRTIVFASIDASVSSTDGRRPVATGTGVFRIT